MGQVAQGSLEGERYATVLQPEPSAYGVDAIVAMSAVEVGAGYLAGETEEVDVEGALAPFSTTTAQALAVLGDGKLVEVLGEQAP